MIIFALGLLASAEAVPPNDGRLERLAEVINRPHGRTTVDIRNAVLVGNSLTMDVVSTDPLAATAEKTASDVRRMVCSRAEFTSLLASPGVEFQFNVFAPDLSTPLKVPVRAEDCLAKAQSPGVQRSSGMPPAAAIARSATTPMDFKGVPLGISYDDFRRLPHPDGYQSKVVCTGDKEIRYGIATEPIGVGIYDTIQIAIGIKKCLWLGTEGYGAGRPAGLNLAGSGYGANDYSFVFVADPKDGVVRLFRFQGITNSLAADEVVDALTAKFGKPIKSIGEVQNGLGNHFQQANHRWSKSGGSLLVQSPSLATNKMTIIMSDDRLEEYVKQQEALKKAATPNGI
jgi:hypothetical protein